MQLKLHLAALMLVVAPLGAQSTAPGADDSCPDRIVASVGGQTITEGDVARYWQSHDVVSFARVRQQLYDGNSTALEGVIADTLLTQEARKRRSSIEQLTTTLESSAAAPTDEEVREMYERSPASKQGLTLEQAFQSIDAYLRRQNAARARQAFVDQLRKATPVDVKLRFDPPRQAIDVSPGEPAIGPNDAVVEVVEFSDFECPYCRQAAPVLKQVLARYGSRVRLVWQDFPLPIHASAARAAEAARCAHEQGRFWQYHDVLFSNQQALAPADLRRYAADVGLDLKAFDSCFGSGKYRSRIAAAMQQGRSNGVTATPTVFINGRIVAGALPFEAYDRIVGEELAAKAICADGLCRNPTRKDER